jgi:AraC family transcriptional regulator, activator of mtrCDE
MCRFGARWASTPEGNCSVFSTGRQRWTNQSNSGQVTAREDGYNWLRSARLALLWSNSGGSLQAARKWYCGSHSRLMVHVHENRCRSIESQRMTLGRSVDPLSGLAPLLRVRPQLQRVCRFGAQWASDHAAETGRWAPFHFVTQGTCVIELNGLGRPIPLSAGDVAVLPHGSRHTVRGPTTPAGARGPFGIHSRPLGAVELKFNTDGEPETQLICGRLRFELAHDNLVRTALPDAIVVSAAANGPVASRLRMLMSAIQDELESARAGAEAIAADLASALFVMIVRIHLDREGCNNGLLRLLAHQQAGRAVAAMLDDPAKSWSLDELAARANASRASLVRMFQRTTQLAPLAFLAALRLELAWHKLSATTRPVAAIADEVGYKSESAFSRAFHRRFGLRPSAARTGAIRSAVAATGSAPERAAL